MKRCQKSFESRLLGFAISLRLNATLANCVCEILYQFTGVFPTDTRVCDAQAVDEFFARQQILTPRFKMAFDHDAEDPGIAVGNLNCHLMADVKLLFRLFAAVAMAAVDHDPCRDAGFRHTLGRRTDVL